MTTIQRPADTRVALPPLPPPFILRASSAGYTDKDMRAYALQVQRETIEACAKVCEVVGVDWIDAQVVEKAWAAEYLARRIRAILDAPAGDAR